jgi:putative NADH-flavin reductase
MSAYAILGATGSTGSSILQLLSASPDNKIHVLVRSKSKLKKVAPSSLENPNIKVFEGSISDHETLAQCLTGTKAVFLTVAITDNKPSCTISQDTAHAVVNALKSIKNNKSNFKAPRLIVLSSSSLDDKFWDDTPPIVHSIIWKCNSNIYTDLAKAEAYLREQEDWLSCTFMMPGAISFDVQRGHELSASKLQNFVSFLDVAAGMIEIADEENGRWEGQNVSVVLKGGQRGRFEWWAPVMLSKGLVLHFFPSMYNYIP